MYKRQALDSSAITYTVSFETNGGSSVADVKVVGGQKLAEPTDPTRSGYRFDGWYTDKDLTAKYDFDKAVESNFTLYAKWTATSSGGSSGGGGGASTTYLDVLEVGQAEWTNMDTPNAVKVNQVMDALWGDADVVDGVTVNPIFANMNGTLVVNQSAITDELITWAVSYTHLVATIIS